MDVTQSPYSSIAYFATEGKQNLPAVLRIVRKIIKKRGLRSIKLLIFTGVGEGPLMAYNMLHEFDVQIVAVTFPPTFAIKTQAGEWVNPQISQKLQHFFKGVQIPVITGRLPFDQIRDAEAHNSQIKLIRDVLSLFGGSFYLLVQAVLQACDFGIVEPGERVIAMTGDSAAIVTASNTLNFLSSEGGLQINEILCKPSGFTLSRKSPPTAQEPVKEIHQQEINVLEKSKEVKSLSEGEVRKTEDHD